MDTDVDLVAKEGSVELLGEKSLAPKLHKRLVEDHVALSLHDANLDGALLTHFWVLLHEALAGLVGLSKSKGRSTGTNTKGLDLTIFGHEESLNWYVCGVGGINGG